MSGSIKQSPSMHQGFWLDARYCASLNNKWLYIVITHTICVCAYSKKKKNTNIQTLKTVTFAFFKVFICFLYYNGEGGSNLGPLISSLRD